MDYLSRLDRKAEKSRPIEEYEEMPSCIDGYYDDLEEHPSASERLNKISPSDARWLAQLVRQNLDSEQERIGVEFEKELAVSSFKSFVRCGTDDPERMFALLGMSGASK